MHIELRDTAPQPLPHAPRGDGEYRAFLSTSLALTLMAGLTVPLLLSLAGALEWDWGRRRLTLTQSHGQLQLLGFAGLYIAGMALRLMPRFSGRRLAYAWLSRPLLVLIAAGVLATLFAALLPGDAASASFSIVGASLVLAGSSAFAAIVWRTLLARDSRAEATAWFFALGSAALVAQGALRLWLSIDVAGSGALLPAAETNALIALQLYGFVMMLIAGIATRAVSTLLGHPRSQLGARTVALVLAAGTVVHVIAVLWSARDGSTEALRATVNVGLLLIAAALVALAWVTGVFHARRHRVASASQVQFWFVRAAFVWLVVAAITMVWHAANALYDGATPDQFQTDAVRHMLTIGVVMMMIFGMSLLVVPEFAGRRLQHPREGILIVAMLVALNASTALRVWPAMEGVGWIGAERYWPIVASAALAMAVTAAFSSMFLQSYLEERAPRSAEALAGRHNPP